MKHTNSMIVLVLGLFMLSVATNTSALAAAPTISNANVQLRTLVTPGILGGEVGVSVSVTVEDSDGLDDVRVAVERPGVFGPFPLQRGLYTSPGDICTPGIFIPLKCTLDSYNVTIGPEFISDAQRAGDYLITVSDGLASVSTTVTLPVGLTPLPAGAQIIGPQINQIKVDTSTGLLRPTVSIPPIPGASGYRIFIQNDSDSTSTTFDGVAGADLSSTPSIRVGANLLAAGKFYRLRIDAFDGITVATSNVRSESADICYDPATGSTDIPCITQKDVHLITESDGTVVMQAIGRVLDKDDLAYLKNPPPTNPPTTICVDSSRCPVSLTRGSFGPFPLTPSILMSIGADSPDSSVTDQFSSSRNPLDASEIPVSQRAGDYNFKAEDSTGNVVTVTRHFPSGMAPLPAAGPLTITPSPPSGQFTPTVSILPVPGASNYRVIVFNDTDSTRRNYDNVPGATLDYSASVPLRSGVIEPNKFYRIHMDAFNDETFSASTVRSRSASMRYDPSGLDSDGDGIQNTIDGQFAGGFVDQSAVATNDFTNQHLGGNEFGTIINRGNPPLDVVVVEPPDTANKGLRIGAAGGGSGEAIVHACPDTVSSVFHRLTERDAEEVKCTSLSVKVLEGIIEYLLGADSVVIAPAGGILTIREPSPGQYSVENSLESFVPITLVTKGEEITVQPGTPGVSLPIVEIKPGDGPNCVNPKSKGLVPVAILGGAVDVTTIVQSSLEIDDDANAATAGVKAAMTAIKDVNGDGVNDLIMQFKTEDLNAAGLLSDGRTLYLTARLSDGALLVGSDVIFLSSGPTCQ